MRLGGGMPFARRYVTGPLFTAASCLMAFGLASNIAAAHHSQAAFDTSAQITLSGRVQSFRWANPHSYIYIEEEGDDSPGVVWELEATPAALLSRLGWDQDSLVPGEMITVLARPPRDSQRKVAFAQVVTKSDGTVLPVADPAALLRGADASRFKATGLSGTWLTLLNPKIAAPMFQGPLQLPLTDAATAAVQSFRASANPGNECVPWAAPLLLVFADIKTITVGEDMVVIRAQSGGLGDARRTIHLDATTHEGVPRSLQGHSIGRWGRDALVVDTTRFTEHLMGIANRVPSSEGKHLTEKFELDPDGASLTYSFVLEDPKYLAKPLVGKVQWAYRPDLKLVYQPCDKDVARHYLDD
jgi:hypothetical protein